MSITYKFRKKQDGEKIYYEMTTKNGSIYSPINSLEDLWRYVKQELGAKDEGCSRVVNEVQEKGESEIDGPDGRMFKI